jgi:hypothetical protein
MKNTKYVAFAILVLLAATAVASVVNQSMFAKAQSSITIDVIASVGGTTNPGPGEYTYTQGVNGSAVLTATPDAGWEFAYWVYSGFNPGHGLLSPDENNQVSDNPFDVTHNYNTEGYVYTYQAVFVPTAAASVNTASGIPIVYVAALIAVLVVAVAAAGFGAYSAGKRKVK